MRSFVLTVMLVACVYARAAATELTLTGDRYWIVLASRQGQDQAIAEARRYDQARPKVIRASNG